jgi:hypothetical protein
MGRRRTPTLTDDDEFLMVDPLNLAGVATAMQRAPSGLFLSNFADTLQFDPQSVFDLDPGFTASSVSWGLVNNTLPALLPAAAF